METRLERICGYGVGAAVTGFGVCVVAEIVLFTLTAVHHCGEHHPECWVPYDPWIRGFHAGFLLCAAAGIAFVQIGHSEWRKRWREEMRAIREG